MDITVRDGMTQPVFDASKAVCEEVFVEIPADTDGDGKRDLIKLFIERPSEIDGLKKVPVIMEISPYYGGTEDPPLHDADRDLCDNAPTDHLSYADVKSRKVIALPPARVPKGKGKALPTKERLVYKSSGWYSYFIPRGYAVVRVCCIGNMFSQGFCNYGGEEETLCATTAIDWLCGRAKAYQDMDNDIEVEAYWCSGNVGMIGLSYNGTLAIAAAAAGVEGLKTIVPFGSISSAYDYYRANGAVAFPGGYLGEDADVCARMCIGRALEKSPVGMTAVIRANCESHLEQMILREDSITGDYNDFWDERNYMNKLHKMKSSVLLVHGLADWNVRTKQFTQLWEGLKKYGVDRKLIVHRLKHEMVEKLSGLNFFESINKWFDLSLIHI